jgi:hypothetical protein
MVIIGEVYPVCRGQKNIHLDILTYRLAKNFFVKKNNFSYNFNKKGYVLFM